eukprot:3004795-Pyramimonas_sp.AAC.1
MQLNFEKNATSADMAACGRDARTKRAHVCSEQAKIKTTVHGIEIDIAREHQHVGTDIHADASWGPE